MRPTALCAFLLVSGAALAQQQGDPALNACQQLLGGANAQTIQMAAQAQTLAKQLEEAKAELAKLKTPPPPEEKK